MTQQICSSGSETETGESTPASLSNPEDHLTDLPVGLSNLQNIQPAAADIPLNLYHTTSNNQPTEKVTVGNSSRIVQQKSFCKNIRDATERQKQRQRQRYQNDPDYAERKKKIPRERQRELRKNPAYMKRRRAQQMERYYNKLACAERKRKPDNNPASAERDRVRPKKMQTE
ncbi:hypothetical protein [Endozoicomonas sp. ALB091]|uniref:hypothetical protein n=1 Tax=Endozoicomonas sp. ALB091 TaxID=3403073 RepID=UPI003BB57669